MEINGIIGKMRVKLNRIFLGCNVISYFREFVRCPSFLPSHSIEYTSGQTISHHPTANPPRLMILYPINDFFRSLSHYRLFAHYFSFLFTDLPKNGPTIESYERIYSIGDILTANCSLSSTRRALANLTWIINNQTVSGFLLFFHGGRLDF